MEGGGIQSVGAASYPPPVFPTFCRVQPWTNASAPNGKNKGVQPYSRSDKQYAHSVCQILPIDLVQGSI